MGRSTPAKGSGSSGGANSETKPEANSETNSVSDSRNEKVPVSETENNSSKNEDKSQESIDKTENGGIIETSNNTDSSEISEKTENKKTGKVYSFEEYNENPLLLGESSPEEKYVYFTQSVYNVSPLKDGNFKGVEYKDGGGYIVDFGDNQSILMYHPEKRSHHKGAYYKLSTGKTGIRRFDMDGKPVLE